MANNTVVLLAFCRAGFEKEVAAELSDVLGHYGHFGYAKVYDSEGYVEFFISELNELSALLSKLHYKDFIFVRHCYLTAGLQAELDPADRVSPLAESLQQLLQVFGVEQISALMAANMDSNEGKSLSKLSKSIVRHLQQRFNSRISSSAQFQVELSFVSGTAGYIGLSDKGNCSPWPQGIPRLRLPKDAPSRATLKLEEAWHHFIPADEWERRLAPSMRAVDLGAAPGGWTWQLVRRSMFVDAVDNGPMAGALMETGQVRHHQCDGFAYTPASPVHWLVCDIADKPARVASMIALWGSEQWCREAIFNLKLPMKQRYKEVQKCEQLITDALNAAGLTFELSFKQLYHDREEVTGHLRLWH
ncbi:23S rRNA (cytidine2498-2'-O)-methyltransferase [Alteromonadaceae bacterium Bs31]|nr:23S rRNA (cytidine2498-2'-O)-methyltransferase [Alteromonadaceae bacterium Bs31]